MQHQILIQDRRFRLVLNPGLPPYKGKAPVGGKASDLPDLDGMKNPSPNIRFDEGELETSDRYSS